jgi:hypothetical protein
MLRSFDYVELKGFQDEKLCGKLDCKFNRKFLTVKNQEFINNHFIFNFSQPARPG